VDRFLITKGIDNFLILLLNFGIFVFGNSLCKNCYFETKVIFSESKVGYEAGCKDMGSPVTRPGGAGHEVLPQVLVHTTGSRVARMRVQAALGCQVQRVQARVRLKNAV
jgi:hypothetical protein